MQVRAGGRSGARRHLVAWLVATALVVALVAVAVVVLATGGDSGDGTVDGGGAANGAGNGAAAAELTSPHAVYERPVAEAEALLAAAGLVVARDTVGCSESVEPGLVRQVTAGRVLNERIIYGKSTDEIDEAAAAALQSRDVVTVWTPLRRPG